MKVHNLKIFNWQWGHLSPAKLKLLGRWYGSGSCNVIQLIKPSTRGTARNAQPQPCDSCTDGGNKYYINKYVYKYKHTQHTHRHTFTHESVSTYTYTNKMGAEPQRSNGASDSISGKIRRKQLLLRPRELGA